jgi:hypothetical protein
MEQANKMQAKKILLHVNAGLASQLKGSKNVSYWKKADCSCKRREVHG